MNPMSKSDRERVSAVQAEIDRLRAESDLQSQVAADVAEAWLQMWRAHRALLYHYAPRVEALFEGGFRAFTQ